MKEPVSRGRCFVVKCNGPTPLDESRSRLLICVDEPSLRGRVLYGLAAAQVQANIVTAPQLAEALRLEALGQGIVDLPTFDVLESQRALAASVPAWASALIVVAPAEPRQRLRRALRSGVSGIVLDEDVDALSAVVGAARTGYICLPGILRTPISRPVLSQRERQTLALAITGLTNAEVAARLFVAPSTVKTHLSAAFHKLGVRSRSEAAALVHDPEEGLTELVFAAAAPVSPSPGAEDSEQSFDPKAGTPA